jgi:hypothetical protein
VNDRLLAPAGDASFAAWRPALEALCGRLYGAGRFALRPRQDSRAPFTVEIEAEAALLADLIGRI